jgi:toxin ParE1/3/4
MTASFRLSPRAKRDLDEIWDYTEANWGFTQAEAYLRQIERSVLAIAADPRLGRSCDEIREGYRKYLTGSHVIFYRIVARHIEIVRILHQSRDFERHM